MLKQIELIVLICFTQDVSLNESANIGTEMDTPKYFGYSII